MYWILDLIRRKRAGKTPRSFLLTETPMAKPKPKNKMADQSELIQKLIFIIRLQQALTTSKDYRVDSLALQVALSDEEIDSLLNPES